MKKLLLLMILVSVALGASAHWGVIITKREAFVYTKESLGFKETVINTRKWGLIDYASNPKVAALLARRGYENAVGELKGSLQSLSGQTNK
jgi:hypothetical protein